MKRKYKIIRLMTIFSIVIFIIANSFFYVHKKNITYKINEDIKPIKEIEQVMSDNDVVSKTWENSDILINPRKRIRVA